jgi:hypothetical protein
MSWGGLDRIGLGRTAWGIEIFDSMKKNIRCERLDVRI